MTPVLVFPWYYHPEKPGETITRISKQRLSTTASDWLLGYIKDQVLLFVLLNKMASGVANESHARLGPINPDGVSRARGSDVERPKPPMTPGKTSLKMYARAFTCILHIEEDHSID